MAKTSPPPDFWRWIELSRVHKFAGSMLIFWPYAWGMTMVARPLSLPLHTYAVNLIYGLVGAAFLHSMSLFSHHAAILNYIQVPVVCGTTFSIANLTDKPIADGRVSVQGALIFLAMHLVLLLALLWPVNTLAWKLGLITVFPLAGIYPLMKRVTYWPQAWLGVAMNMISLVAWSALRARLHLASGALILGLWCWTLYYDTIYACQDKRDDVQAGVKSTALLFGAHVKKVLAVLAGSLVTCLAVAGALNNQGIPYFVLTVGGAAAHLAMQLRNLDVDDQKSCLTAFESNGFTLGEIVWGGLFVDYVLG